MEDRYPMWAGVESKPQEPPPPRFEIVKTTLPLVESLSSIEVSAEAAAGAARAFGIALREARHRNESAFLGVDPGRFRPGRVSLGAFPGHADRRWRKRAHKHVRRFTRHVTRQLTEAVSARVALERAWYLSETTIKRERYKRRAERARQRRQGDTDVVVPRWFRASWQVEARRDREFGRIMVRALEPINAGQLVAWKR
jgi:hypothetical protein